MNKMETVLCFSVPAVLAAAAAAGAEERAGAGGPAN